MNCVIAGPGSVCDRPRRRGHIRIDKCSAPSLSFFLTLQLLTLKPLGGCRREYGKLKNAELLYHACDTQRQDARPSPSGNDRPGFLLNAMADEKGPPISPPTFGRCFFACSCRLWPVSLRADASSRVVSRRTKMINNDRAFPSSSIRGRRKLQLQYDCGSCGI